MATVSTLLTFWPPAPEARHVDHSRSLSGICAWQLVGSGSTATVIVDVWTRPLRSVGGTRCQRWPPLSLANKAWASGPSTRNTIMPGRSSIRTRLKTPPPRKLEIDAELFANEQFSIVAAFRGADFDNTHSISPLIELKNTGSAALLGYSEAAEWDADVNSRFTSPIVSHIPLVVAACP